ncbi:unnamed protein product [Penicillium salamii]|uniref:Uncharacterized protein n=1 Tax=Penicillium salamii TaxID=1612424 RepID=A0A9W4JXD3_9EURO|nr:unnamed protein product [Penicillium salamii]CAG8029754.1 unnamed protein product [Penicillium salamii]CAG8064754.1 unnamed protein product [Penicillium salamii]CAG8233287.1 unnamed protein product [Penicillium salamii]CAG8308968.1 unnamed protein product [Penicillium salamii]
MLRYPHALTPISEEISPADHEVLRNGGSSSTIERLPSRLQAAKRILPDDKTRSEQHAYEASYLRAELQWHKESKQVFLRFHERVSEIFGMMEDAIAESMTNLQEAERRYLSIWDHSLDHAPEGNL